MKMTLPQDPPTKPAAERARLLLAAFDAAPDGLIVLNPEGLVVLCNREAATLAGLGNARVSGQPFAELARLSALNWAPIEELVASGRSGDMILRSDGMGAIFVTLRRIADQPGALALTLRDLAVFDHARRRATGERDPAGFSSTVERRLRPDFARQRQLSPYLDRIIARGERALLQGARVIITGESGVGKTEIARHLHSFVANGADPFVAVNCAAIPETLFESELFGYERGAFTGALTEGKKGLIEAAEGGTLFLDEIGEIPLTLQAKLLSFLEDGLVLRVGSTRPRRVNLRIITATNRDLLEMAEDRRFRLDLYYRLAVVNMPIKPLRDMPELLDHLIERFLTAINQRRAQPLVLSADLRARLLAYHYPGNIRELANLLQQISVLGDGEDELPRRLQSVQPAPDPGAEGGSLRAQVAGFETRVIEEAIRIHGSKRKAAAALGVDIGTIVRKTRKEP
ncbi:Transcriptional regulator containing PAS, AAA-type ATPase, and DNA-binding Fis domains [Gemmobacter aquatilis]|uniref:HTH-type transcriptional regulatory protein TyrR n=1 Tax=Gemmobacter aquatilis TaxID=933059 RepID=A0A1H8A4R4_9RHOB|nr:sigma 54-interacting transcriptional regulator [Gemmobacter aquatilis]SEM64537.1 Transcriptional regulator containing PAS, AAA-type ATPase, and DNA-binding Fis domains [Gemmobacter aquatilis]